MLMNSVGQELVGVQKDGLVCSTIPGASLGRLKCLRSWYHMEICLSHMTWAKMTKKLGLLCMVDYSPYMYPLRFLTAW